MPTRIQDNKLNRDIAAAQYLSEQPKELLEQVVGVKVDGKDVDNAVKGAKTYQRLLVKQAKQAAAAEQTIDQNIAIEPSMFSRYKEKATRFAKEEMGKVDFERVHHSGSIELQLKDGTHHKATIDIEHIADTKLLRTASLGVDSINMLFPWLLGAAAAATTAASTLIASGLCMASGKASIARSLAMMGGRHAVFAVASLIPFGGMATYGASIGIDGMRIKQDRASPTYQMYTAATSEMVNTLHDNPQTDSQRAIVEAL